MSRYLQLNDQDEAAELSSNTGWSEFIAWVSTIAADEFPALVDFTKTGSTKDPQKVADQIEAAMDESEPDADTKSVAQTLFEYLDGEEGIASVV